MLLAYLVKKFGNVYMDVWPPQNLRVGIGRIFLTSFAFATRSAGSLEFDLISEASVQSS